MEIIKIDNTLISNGNIKLEMAETYANDFIFQLSPNLYGIAPDIIEEVNLTMAGGIIDENTIEVDVVEGFSLIYIRHEGEYNTSDKIILNFDTNGVIQFYFKIWNLQIPSSTTPEITKNEAIAISYEYLDPESFVDADLMIVRPNYLWTWGMRYGFSEGVLCWVVIEYYDNSHEYPQIGVFVDAINGEIIGGL